MAQSLSSDRHEGELRKEPTKAKAILAWTAVIIVVVAMFVAYVIVN